MWIRLTPTQLRTCKVGKLIATLRALPHVLHSILSPTRPVSEAYGNGKSSYSLSWLDLTINSRPWEFSTPLCHNQYLKSNRHIRKKEDLNHSVLLLFSESLPLFVESTFSCGITIISTHSGISSLQVVLSVNRQSIFQLTHVQQHR